MTGEEIHQNNVSRKLDENSEQTFHLEFTNLVNRKMQNSSKQYKL